jgi:endonuclease IV
MTQDEIIEMAKKAGWKDMKDYDSEMNESFFIGKFTDLKTFAKLVAQHEREACANVCINIAHKWTRMGAWGTNNEYHECANAIRARGQA